MNTITLTFSSKPALLDALRARRPELVAIDDHLLADHQKAEKAALTEFRRACRDAAKLDYQEAKRIHGDYRARLRLETPSCPSSLTAMLDAVVKSIELTGQKTFTIAPGGRWSTVHHLLTFDPDATVEMC